MVCIPIYIPNLSTYVEIRVNTKPTLGTICNIIKILVCGERIIENFVYGETAKCTE